MFKKWKKKKILKSFVLRVPVDLAKRYGIKDFYTQGQLSRTIDECNYSPQYHGYAQVIFLTKDAALEIIKDSMVYESIRHELANKFF